MNRYVRPGAALAASVLALTAFNTGAAEAKTKKELKACWASTVPGLQNLTVKFVADGPTYKSKTLHNGQCFEWDVKPGQYKISIANLSDFWDKVNADGDCPDLSSERLKARIKRSGDSAQDDTFEWGASTSTSTTVAKNRRTTVALHLRCVPWSGPI